MPPSSPSFSLYLSTMLQTLACRPRGGRSRGRGGLCHGSSVLDADKALDELHPYHVIGLEKAGASSVHRSATFVVSYLIVTIRL